MLFLFCCADRLIPLSAFWVCVTVFAGEFARVRFGFMVWNVSSRAVFSGACSDLNKDILKTGQRISF